MDKIFIFDVDGTLTPSRLPMTKEFQKFFVSGKLIKDSKFSKLKKKRKLYIFFKF